jgi:hypothetical protein
MNAMFNSSGGTIYLGVKEDKKTQTWTVEEGVMLNDDEQDRIKQHVARIFARFHPSVPMFSNVYDVKFIDVSEGKKRIAIHIDSSKRRAQTVYFISDDKSVAYERVGSSCEPIRSSMITRTIASAEDSKQHSCIASNTQLEICTDSEDDDSDSEIDLEEDDDSDSDTDSDELRCYNCNGIGHYANECPSRMTCYRCGRTSHLINQCYAKTHINGHVLRKR